MVNLFAKIVTSCIILIRSAVKTLQQRLQGVRSIQQRSYIMEQSSETCPCGSGLVYAECCEPRIRGERPSLTAEQLMRSRYTAYVKKEIPYLYTTLHPDHRKDYNEKSTREWAENAVWHGLEIVTITAGGTADPEGVVEFIASFSQGETKTAHHELASFSKVDGNWYFVHGEPPTPKTVVRTSPKVGRNDPCTCGSRKKYKKCCGQ